MAPHRIYVSSSTQSKNVGVGNYGTEQDRMMQLSDRVAYWLKTQKGRFEVFRNQPGWTLDQTIAECNSLACDLFIDNHTDAGPSNAMGTTVFYNGVLGCGSKSHQIAEVLYKHIAPLSPGTDRGVKPDTILYKSGLAVIQRTKPPACLIEHLFHTNIVEVNDMLAHMDKYAKAEAKAIVEYMGEKWEEPNVEPQTIENLVANMISDGIIMGPAKHWIDVLKGNAPANPQFLQIAFKRATDKIR